MKSIYAGAEGMLPKMLGKMTILNEKPLRLS